MSRKKDRPLTLEDVRALAGIRRRMRLFLQFSAGAARARGFTPAQHQALLAIKSLPQPVSVGTLADWLGVRPHSAVGLINRLVRLRLVVRLRDGGDKRRVDLKLSRRAEEKLTRLSRVHRAELRRFSKVLAPLLEVLH